MDELVKIALVGTARHPAAGLDPDDPADALLASRQDETPEGLLLLRAGAKAALFQAGYQPDESPASPEPSPADNAPRGSRRLVGLLQNALTSDAKELLPEFVALMRGSGLLAPPELLPLILDVQDPALRELLLPVLGERGRWLSRFNPAWVWVSRGVGALSVVDRGQLRRQWDEGNITERAAVLRRLREADPAEARQWLQQVFKQEKPEHRNRLLQQFEAGLNADDEPLLEETLADRSEVVRRTAAMLLARLPSSQLAMRMVERADQMLSVAPGKRGALRLTCSPPTEIDSAWKRDGVSDQAPSGRGKRAVWTEAVLRAVSPDHWTQRFNAAPPEMIEAIREDDFAVPVLQGWTQAALAFAATVDAAKLWFAPLWRYWAERRGKQAAQSTADSQQHLADLLSAMPREQAETCLRERIKAAGGSPDALTPHLVGLLPRPWSADFSRVYLKTTLAAMAAPASNAAYRWLCTLFDAARSIPHECFREALAMVEQSAVGLATRSGQYTGREIDKFIEIIRLRESFFEEIQS